VVERLCSDHYNPTGLLCTVNCEINEMLTHPLLYHTSTKANTECGVFNHY